MWANYKHILYGMVGTLIVLALSGVVYKGYLSYTAYQELWTWANTTHGWVQTTDANIKELDKIQIGLAANLRGLTKNANIQSMLLQQSRLDKIEARLDKLEAQPQTEAEDTEPEGKEG